MVQDIVSYQIKKASSHEMPYWMNAKIIYSISGVGL